MQLLCEMVITVMLAALAPSLGFIFHPNSGVVHSRYAKAAQSGWRRTWGLLSQPAHRQCASKLSATAEARGAVEFIAENGELTAEETVEIIYTPPKGMFRESGGLMYCGGFNGWDGDDDALTAPMIPIDNGQYRVTVTVPNFAKVLDFVVTDGVRYDTGPDGTFYHGLVTHVQEADSSGNIITYRQEPDGTLIKTGVIEKVDPQELERMMEEATGGPDTVNLRPEPEPAVDDAIFEVQEGLRQEITVTIDEQEAVQKMRAEASVLGEKLGLGNMQANEARDAFDMHDDANGELLFEDLGKVLEKLGLEEVDSKMQSELIGKHVLEGRPNASTITLMEFMHIFKELDVLDVGIDIC